MIAELRKLLDRIPLWASRLREHGARLLRVGRSVPSIAERSEALRTREIMLAADAATLRYRYQEHVATRDARSAVAALRRLVRVERSLGQARRSRERFESSNTAMTGASRRAHARR